MNGSSTSSCLTAFWRRRAGSRRLASVAGVAVVVTPLALSVTALAQEQPASQAPPTSWASQIVNTDDLIAGRVTIPFGPSPTQQAPAPTVATAAASSTTVLASARRSRPTTAPPQLAPVTRPPAVTTTAVSRTAPSTTRPVVPTTRPVVAATTRPTTVVTSTTRPAVATTVAASASPGVNGSGPAEAVAVVGDGPDAWAKLRKCESGGRYDLSTGNGYYGAYQFALGTWQKLGYDGYPHQASPAVQDEAARKLQARAGWGQWPACSRKLGLR